MSSYPPLADCLAVKHYCWRMYSHRKWFKGCGLNTDEEECVVEIRKDPTYTDRFTYVSEKDGVKIRVVDFDSTKHSEMEAQ